MTATTHPAPTAAAQAETAFARACHKALAQLRADTPAMQFWTAAAQKDADDRCVAALLVARRASVRCVCGPLQSDPEQPDERPDCPVHGARKACGCGPTEECDTCRQEAAF